MAELKEEKVESPDFDEVNAGGSALRGGGGGFGSDPFGYIAINYYGDGIYFGSFSNPYQYCIGLSFYNDNLGLTQWYPKDGFAMLEQIMYDYNPESHNDFNGRGVHDVSNAGLNFIAGYEGYSATTYNDVAGLATIGYGHLIKSGESFGTLSRSAATQLLRKDASFAVNAVNKYVKVSLNQNQFDALTSLTFNIGAGGFSESSVLRNVNSGNTLSIDKSFMMWNKAAINGVLTPVQGLTNRRQAESNLFMNGDY